MSNTASITIKGLDDLIRRLRDKNLLAPALHDGMKAAGFLLESEAKKRAPVDRGLLRSSIAHEVFTEGSLIGARIGAKPKYAPYMEYGTGLVHDHPSWPRKRHVVPAGALAGWGKRKGLDGAAVARSITKRGGLTPRRYLRGALEDNQARVVKVISGHLKRAEQTFAGS